MDASHALLKLHQYLMRAHHKNGALIGPDPGVRFNYRIFRFIKSYLRALPWRDNLYYLQTQGYWTLGNARLYQQTGDAVYRRLLTETADTILARQRPDGAWPYPNPEWSGRVATAEGVWGSIGLIEAYRVTDDQRYLDGAYRWERFMLDVIGFQRMGEQAAINYFASTRLERIPNNSTFAIRFLAELMDVDGERDHLEPVDGMLAFLQAVQADTGEIPYAVSGTQGGSPMRHFQCYQYNAFQCLDLLRYHALTGDDRVRPMIEGLLRFLQTGVQADGSVTYACDERSRSVTYHAAVTAAAFATATDAGFGDYTALAGRIYAYVLSRQRSDGSFPHSRGDYRLLQDQRSYPRYLSMILFHLLHQPVTEATLQKEV